MFKWILLFAILVSLGAVLALSVRFVPEQHNPLTPLDLDDPIGMTTGLKLAKFRKDPEACFGFLDDSQIKYTRLEESEPGEPCGFYNALTLDQSALPYNATLSMTCAQTAALVVWERRALVERAQQYFEAPPVRVLTYGSFSCRRLYGRETGRYSQHASGNAIDVYGVEFADGKRITVSQNWGEETPEGAFLKDLRDDSCRIFGTVLGPEYNKAHADHFHLDMNRTGICK